MINAASGMTQKGLYKDGCLAHVIDFYKNKRDPSYYRLLRDAHSGTSHLPSSLSSSSSSSSSETNKNKNKRLSMKPLSRFFGFSPSPSKSKGKN